MDLDNFYGSVVSFWSVVSPVFLAHIIVIGSVVWASRFQVNIISYLEYLLNTETYKRWRDLFDEFGQRSKIPYLIVVALLIYLALFNSVLNVVTLFEPLQITWSEIDFWKERRPLLELAEIGAYSGTSDLHIWDISEIRRNYLERYKTTYPERYRSSVGWMSDEFSRWLTCYKLSIVACFVYIFFLVHETRLKRRRTTIGRFVLLLLLSLVSIGISRYQSEQWIEKRLQAETIFITSQLNMDSRMQEKRLPKGDFEVLQANLYGDLKHLDVTSLHNNWFSRFLERLSIGKRVFYMVTDAEFQEKFGYLETMSLDP